MSNDPVQDGHFKTNNNMHEWDEVVFGDLNEMELFWLNPGMHLSNPPHRKLDMEGNVMNTKTQQTSTIPSKTKVYVRT